MRAKKCKVCKVEFVPLKPLQLVCSFECARDKVIADRIKADAKACRIARAELRVAKERIKSRGQHTREAQAAFNAFIRERDHEHRCISCGRDHQGQHHAGHYRATSTAPELRFNEINVHKQCSACNNHLHGNLINYRVGLIQKIGIDKVEWLEGPHEPAKYTIDQLKEIKKTYNRKARELKRKREITCQ